MMTRLDEAADDAALSPAQRVEERIGSVDYDVWACASCPERLVIAYSRRSSYRGCPKCDARTLSSTTRTLKAATQFSTGLEETTLDCAHCGFHDVTRRITPVLPPPPPPPPPPAVWPLPPKLDPPPEGRIRSWTMTAAGAVAVAVAIPA